MVRTDPDPTAFPASEEDLIREPLANRFLPDKHIPARITLINGALLWGGSRIYRMLFGIGVNEWRVLGALSNVPGATAARVGRDVGMNKAIASRSIAALAEKGLVAQEAAGRARRLYLTRAGADLFTRIQPIAAERERVLLDGLTPGEVDTLRELLSRLVDRGDALRASDDLLLAGRDGEDADAEVDED